MKVKQIMERCWINETGRALAYITDAFGGVGIRVQAFYDTAANFTLTAGDGVFMAYLNPQSAGNDDVALTMTIWAH